jgi:hypothetical protein
MNSGSGSARGFVLGVFKGVLICLCSSFALLIGNYLASTLATAPIHLGIRVPGAVLCGLAAGCLTALLGFRRRGVLLSAIFALAPILYSWFVRGARSYTHTYRYQGGKLVPITASHVVYSQLVSMVLVACIVSIAVFLLCRAVAHRRR